MNILTITLILGLILLVLTPLFKMVKQTIISGKVIHHPGVGSDPRWVWIKVPPEQLQRNKRRYLIPCWWGQIPNVFLASATIQFVGIKMDQTWLAVPLCICSVGFFVWTLFSTCCAHDEGKW